ncbi:hypothetical protein PR048_010335 [Dryococelus australis]|uniref:Male-enhanced antigen 1 n=1 Tax=Dryococelus australis TaxID=614101 RepID=A0ABQ9I398_9NEOP|nr:hypothetical protein PR048_010335 [Dryococelus australis]
MVYGTYAWQSNFDEGTTAELRELWSAPATRVDFDLGVDKVQAVQEAMSGVTLPASAIPEWAASVPEDQWRQQIMDRIQELKAVK